MSEKQSVPDWLPSSRLHACNDLSSMETREHCFFHFDFDFEFDIVQMCETSITRIILPSTIINNFFIGRCDQQISYGKQLIFIFIDMYWGCLSHELDARGAVALKVCSSSQIFPLVTLIAGINYNTLHVHVFLLRFAIMIFRFPFLTVHILRYLGPKGCPNAHLKSDDPVLNYKASLLLYTI